MWVLGSHPQLIQPLHSHNLKKQFVLVYCVNYNLLKGHQHWFSISWMQTNVFETSKKSQNLGDVHGRRPQLCCIRGWPTPTTFLEQTCSSPTCMFVILIVSHIIQKIIVLPPNSWFCLKTRPPMVDMRSINVFLNGQYVNHQTSPMCWHQFGLN